MPSASPYLARHHGPNWGLIMGVAFSIAVWGVTLEGVGSVAHVYASKGEHSFRHLMSAKIQKKARHLGEALKLG